MYTKPPELETKAVVFLLGIERRDRFDTWPVKNV